MLSLIRQLKNVKDIAMTTAGALQKATGAMDRNTAMMGRTRRTAKVRKHIQVNILWPLRHRGRVQQWFHIWQTLLL